MKKIYFDIVSGASGDMLLASLVDLGVPVAFLNEQYAKMPLEHIHLTAEKVDRNGMQCTLIDPKFEHSHEYRHLHQILDIIKAGGFSDTVYAKCEAVLNAIAEAEANVHGVDKHHIHFHEIGAVDTILDITGVVLGLEYLGIESVEFSTITDGHGTVKTAHGVIPVPVPATAELIKGFELKIIDVPTELVTPTGAALLTVLGKQKKGMSGTVVSIGCSCGTKRFDNHPNILRAFVLDEKEDGSIEEIVVLETDMDHISGEIMGHAAQVLFDNGALDVSWIPLYMKKGRPAYRLSVIASVNGYQTLVDQILLQTRTLGVRIQKMQRAVATRSFRQVSFSGHELTEKVCEYKGKSFTKLEYDALCSLAKERNVTLVDLIEEYAARR
ncbi:MAG: nickel pincer cofactor biosynthesis protein LarC [Fibrobacterota bacterium]